MITFLRELKMKTLMKVNLLATVFLLGMTNFVMAQESPEEPQQTPKEEDKIYYTCETYTDSGEYKLSAVLNFTLESYTGILEVLWVNETRYGELPRLRHGASLNSSRVREGKVGRTPVFIVESNNARTGNKIKVVVPMKAEIYGNTMGEIHVNDESFEVKCSVEIDTY